MNRMRNWIGLIGALALAGAALGSVNVDSAANYAGGWTNGANGGGGFGAWSLAAAAGAGWAGCGIWDSAAASLNLGYSFGFVAKGAGAVITMDRPFAAALAAGDTFKLDLGLNYDSGSGGNKGFSLRTADNREIVVVNQGASEVVTVNGAAAFTNYGVNTMYWTFTQMSATQVTVYATGRAGAETFTATVKTNVASFLANVHFYASAITNDADAEFRQVYFDNLTLTQGASDTNLFRYSVENGRAIVTGVLASAAGDLVVPAMLGGYVVGGAGRGAFQDLTNVTSVSFAGGANVTNLGPQAFQGCTALTNVALPEGLKTLSPGLFYGCTALKSATIPSGVTNVGDAAFAECRQLASATLPGGLTGLGPSPFLNCRSLGAIAVPAGIASVPEQFCYECRSLATADLPAGATQIGRAAFFNCFGLTGLTLAGALDAVGAQAFAGCVGLEKLTFKGGVDSLGAEVFWNCPALAGVYFLCDMPAAGDDLFLGADLATVYYLVSPSSWGATFGGVPAVAWAPEAVSLAATNGAFRIALEWAAGQTIQVQASRDLVAPVWQDVGTYVTTDGTASVVDTNWAATTARFYRFVSP